MGPEKSSPEYCLARAAECDQLAEQAHLKVTKDIYFDLARRWRTLAGDGTAAFEPVGRALAARLDNPRAKDMAPVWRRPTGASSRRF